MKRFTATEKWDDPWFWELTPAAKLLWLFLCDHCDHAGIIEINFKFSSMKIGLPINENHLTELQSRLHSLPCGKILILGFIRFQYGTPNRSVKPHNPIFASLSKHGLDLAQFETLSKGFGNGLDTLKDKEKDKEKDKREGVQGEGHYHPDSRAALYFLNESSGRHFRETDANLSFISSRLKEDGVTIDGVKMMISRQCKLWKSDPKMCEYLRPETLFNKTKFDAYYAAREVAIASQTTQPNPRNAGIIEGPTNYATAKPRLQRQLEEKARLAQQVAQDGGTPLPA